MQPTLSTPRLLLRPLTPDDVRPLHTIWGDVEVIWWGASADLDETAELVARILDRTAEMRDGLGWWLIVHHETIVGDVVLQVPRWDPDVVEVGWHLHRDHQGNGYATEAARELLRHGFEELDLPSVDAIVDERNEDSKRVAERLGMRRIGAMEHAGRPHARYRLEPDELTTEAGPPSARTDLEHSSGDDQMGAPG